MKRMLTTTVAAAALFGALSVSAQAEQWVLDPSHSQIVFSYDHLGFSTTYGMFSGFDGTIDFDPENPEAASVSIEIPASSLITGWDQRDSHFLSGDFFKADANPVITFTSTSVEVTGDNTANITGDLSVAGVTKPVTLATTFAGVREHPIANKPWTGFDATTTLLRSDFGMGNFAPVVGDEVSIIISVEAQPAE